MTGVVRSSGDVMNRLEREMGREEFNDAAPEVAFKRMYVTIIHGDQSSLGAKRLNFPKI